jgi:hypothetical protein
MSGQSIVQIFVVDTSTWAVTTAGASLNYDSTDSRFPSCFQIDSTHFINFFSGSNSDGYVQTFTVNTST